MSLVAVVAMSVISLAGFAYLFALTESQKHLIISFVKNKLRK
jgi:hypothetical protein